MLSFQTFSIFGQPTSELFCGVSFCCLWTKKKTMLSGRFTGTTHKVECKGQFGRPLVPFTVELKIALAGVLRTYSWLSYALVSLC